MLGVPVRATRAVGTVLAVLLTAASVTLAGPIGFVGLFAPVIVRLVGAVVPALNRHVVLIPAAGLMGAFVVVLADALLRAVLGADEAISIPTGITTTIAGALVMIFLARRGRDSGPAKQSPAARVGVRSRLRFVVVLVLAVVAALGVTLLGLLGGDTWLRTGDVALWLNDEGAPLIRFALDERAPRVAAAVLGGAALALSGSLVQSTCRNPLAEPGILGITGGAGVGAVIVVTGSVDRRAVQHAVLVGAVLGALVSFALVYGLSWRHGLDADRLLLIGIGTWYGAAALTTFLLVRSNPWDTPRIYTWLSGTTYGRTLRPGAARRRRAGRGAAARVGRPPRARPARARRGHAAPGRRRPRAGAAARAPRRRAAGRDQRRRGRRRRLRRPGRAAHGARPWSAAGTPAHCRSPCSSAACCSGAADLIGRTVIAPAQVPAGLVVAIIGAPYFVLLLARSRA